MKKIVNILVVFLGIALLQGCYNPGPPPQQPRTVEQFSIELKTDKPVYRVGENVTVTVRANRDCYLSLYNTSSEGEVTQIFPNTYASDNLIQAGQVYRIPTETDSFDFELEGPPGTERIRAVGTMANVNLVEGGYKESDEEFPHVGNDPEQFDQNVDQKLGTMSAEQWAEASVTYRVE